MRTHKNLYPRICDFENLYLAYRAARKSKRGKEPVAAFEREQERELLQLQSELRDETYTPGPYHSFYIHEPKRRLISAAAFRDRVVHHALIRVIEPIGERRFIFDSYANRIGKGTHRALDRCQQFSRRYPYALQCDVRQFFPSIDHAILRDALARHIADDAVLRLCDRIWYGRPLRSPRTLGRGPVDCSWSPVEVIECWGLGGCVREAAVCQRMRNE